MNEQIKQLAEQARQYAEEKQNDPFRIYTLDCFNEKFAQLIVRECIGLLPDDCQSKNGCHTSWVMKEHFGVE
jgi:hypothetical protein